MTLSTEFNKSHIWQKKRERVCGKTGEITSFSADVTTSTVSTTFYCSSGKRKMSFFASFPGFSLSSLAFYVSAQESLFFFTALSSEQASERTLLEAELLNEQTLASNEMQACLQNGGKERGNFPGAEKRLAIWQNYSDVRHSFLTT